MKRKYSPEMEDEIRLAYTICESQDDRNAVVLEFSEKWGKPPRSIIAKLSKMKIYVPKERISNVTGGPARTKEQIAKDIARLMNYKPEELLGLEQAPKRTLQRMKDYLTLSSQS